MGDIELPTIRTGQQDWVLLLAWFREVGGTWPLFVLLYFFFCVLLFELPLFLAYLTLLSRR